MSSDANRTIKGKRGRKRFQSVTGSTSLLRAPCCITGPFRRTDQSWVNTCITGKWYDDAILTRRRMVSREAEQAKESQNHFITRIGRALLRQVLETVRLRPESSITKSEEGLATRNSQTQRRQMGFQKSRRCRSKGGAGPQKKTFFGIDQLVFIERGLWEVITRPARQR